MRPSLRRSIRGSRVLAQPYRECVWLAYLVLPPSAGEERRLLLAHRMAATALTRRGHRGEPATRAAFLRKLLATKPRPWQGRLGSFEAIPAVTRSADLEFTKELNALPAPARAAYALRRLEERPAEQVAALLADAGVGDPAAALAQVAALEERHGGTLRRPAADPTLARLYGRPPRLPGAGRLGAGGAAGAAGVVLLALVAAVVVPRLGLERPGNASVPAGPRALAAAEHAWREGTQLDLTTWSPRGDLTADKALTGRALRAWEARDAQLLFAGRLDGANVVLLRRPGQVARYTESGPSPTLVVRPEPRAKPDGASPLKLRTTARGSRYLLPPWVREVSATDLSGTAPRWRTITARNGVTAQVAPAGSAGCWRGPVLRLRAPDIAHGLPYTMLDFGELQLAEATYQPPPRPRSTATGRMRWTARRAGSARGRRSAARWTGRRARCRRPRRGSSGRARCRRRRAGAGCACG